MINGKTVAIVPGSFDPITNGHIDIAKRAAEKYDIVYLAVMVNPKKQYMFTIEQRENIAKKAVSEIKNVSVISSEGMLWKLAQDLHADAIVKGYRNAIDYEYEMNMARFNHEHYPLAETVLLKANDKLVQMSSTLLREKINNNESFEDCLPPAAADEVKRILFDLYQ